MAEEKNTVIENMVLSIACKIYLYHSNKKEFRRIEKNELAADVMTSIFKHKHPEASHILETVTDLHREYVEKLNQAEEEILKEFVGKIEQELKAIDRQKETEA